MITRDIRTAFSPVHGVGVFARGPMCIGEEIYTPPTNFLTSRPFGGLNHACTPNVEKTEDPFTLRVVSPVSTGDELFLRYPDAPVPCRCPACSDLAHSPAKSPRNAAKSPRV